MHIEKLPRFHDLAMATFIIDDVRGHTQADADAFCRFSGWVEQAGLKGECSSILGIGRDDGGKALPLHKAYAAEVDRASRKHLDANMEVMTHNHLYDFQADRMSQAAPHEGVWLMDPTHKIDEYTAYFENIVSRAAEAGFKPAGLTLPGCGCEPCVTRKGQLGIGSPTAYDLNAAVPRALLQLAQAGKLATPVCSLFVGKFGKGPVDAQEMLAIGGNAVYDVPPAVGADTLGRWDNLPEFLNLDAYITADGSAGRLPELIAQQTITMGYYSHWQAIRPDTGIGFGPFQELAGRIGRSLGDKIVWMRPTEIAMYRHTERYTQLHDAADASSFSLSIPFAPLHPVSFRVLGRSQAKIRTPSGQTVLPWKALPSQACAIFDILPEMGRYEIVG